MGVDSKDLKKFKEKIDKLAKEDIYNMYDYMARKIALQFLGYVIPDTPVITGALRRGWIGETGPGSEPTQSEMKKFTDSMPVKRIGKRMSVTITNNIHYAPYVNWGHRQGRRWVDGQYMLERATANINSAAEPLLNTLANEYLTRYFK